MFDLGAMLDRDNLDRAWKAVEANRGGAGEEGMVGAAPKDYPFGRGAGLVRDARGQRCKPALVRRVFIPKEGGMKRPLGMPAVADRFVRQAAIQVLGAECENVFSVKREIFVTIFET